MKPVAVPSTKSTPSAVSGVQPPVASGKTVRAKPLGAPVGAAGPGSAGSRPVPKRSCTPDGREGEEHAFRDSTDGAPSADESVPAAAAPVPPQLQSPPPQAAGMGASHSTHVLLGRVKGTVREMVAHISSVNAKDADDFIAVLEDALRAVKTAKVEARASRSKPPGTPSQPASSRTVAGAAPLSPPSDPLLSPQQLNPDAAKPLDIPVQKFSGPPPPTEETKVEHEATPSVTSPSNVALPPAPTAAPQNAADSKPFKSYAAALRGIKTPEKGGAPSAAAVSKAPSTSTAAADKRPAAKTPTLHANPTVPTDSTAPSAETLVPVPELSRTVADIEKEEAAARATLEKDEVARFDACAKRAAEDVERVQVLEEEAAKKARDAAEEAERKAKEAAEKQRRAREEKDRRLKAEEERRRAEAEKAKLEKERKERERVEKEAADKAAQEAANAMTEEEHRTATKLARIATTVHRLATLYVEVYKQQAPRGHKDLNKSKLRGVLQRLTTSDPRAAFKEMLSHCSGADHDGSFTQLDIEFLRYNEGLEAITRRACEASSCRDPVLFRLATDVLRRVLMDPAQGDANVDHFIQAGCFAPLIQLLYDEFALSRRSGAANISYTAGVSLTLVQLCLPRLLDPSVKALSSMRDHAMDLLTTAGIFDFIIDYAAACRSSDVAALAAGLGVLAPCLPVVARRKTTVTEQRQWTATIVAVMVRILHLILAPGGAALKATAEITPTASATTYLAFRILNTIARHDIPTVQLLVSPTPKEAAASGAESSASASLASASAGGSSAVIHKTPDEVAEALYGVIEAILRYYGHHDAVFESLPSFNAPVAAKGLTQSYRDALKFGITTAGLPPPPLLQLAGADGTISVARAPAKEEGWYLRATMHEMVLFVGYISVLNQPMQRLLGEVRGDATLSLLQQLVATLPANYFMLGKHILFPTLIAAAFGCESNKAALQSEMSVKELADFLNEEIALLKGPKPIREQADEPAAEEAKPKEPSVGAGSKAVPKAGSAARLSAGQNGPAAGATAGVASIKHDSSRTQKSWAELMEEEEDGLEWEDPLSQLSASSPAPSWAKTDTSDNNVAPNASRDAAGAVGIAARVAEDAASGGPVEHKRVEKLHAITHGPIPQGIPSVYVYYRLPRRVPCDFWASARDFFTQ